MNPEVDKIIEEELRIYQEQIELEIESKLKEREEAELERKIAQLDAKKKKASPKTTSRRDVRSK